MSDPTIPVKAWLGRGLPVQPGRALGIAVVGSLAFHAAALFGVPQLDFSWLRTNASGGPPLEARIVASSAPAAVPPVAVAKPAPAPAAKPKPKPRPKPPVAEAPAMTIESAEPPPAVNEQLRERFETADAGSVEGDLAPPDLPAPPADAAPQATPAPEAAVPEPSASPVVDPAPPPIPPAAEPPAKYPLRQARLVYDLVYGFGGAVAGRVIHTLAIDEGRYQVETVAEPVGLLALFYGGKYVQRSRGHLGAAGFVPDQYFVMRGKESRTETATFDWSAQRVTFRWPNETRTAELASGVQDTVSMLHQFYFLRPLDHSSRLRLATGRKLYDSAYEVLGEETIDTPLGPIATLHIRRREDDADRIDLWIDPSRNYLPMRIYYEDRKKNVLEQTIREYTVETSD